MTRSHGGIDQQTLRMLASSAPAFLVERLIELDDCWSREMLRTLRRREWMLRLHPLSTSYGKMSRLLPAGTEPPSLETPPRRVWCISARPDPWEPSRPRFGTVHAMGIAESPAVNPSDFERSCTAGVSAALAWLQSKVVFARLPLEWRCEPVSLLGSRTCEPPPEGGSAGLAAALATVGELLSRTGMPLFQHVAATGVVAADGKVQPVDFLREKLEGIVREAPFVPLVLVPDLNLADVPGGLPLQVVPVKSVSEALDLFWGGTDLGRIQARHSPVTAGEEAFRLERRQRHAQADVLAGHVLSELAGKELESRKTRVAAVQALAVRGINFTHRGDTANALADFARIDDLVRREGLAEVPGILPIDLRTLVLAARTSTMLDALDCRDAIAACDELRGRLHDVSADVALPFLGSLLRCQTAAGLLDEAELTWSTYHDLVDEPEDKPRMWCYRIELLVKKAVRGDAGALRKASDALKEGLDANRGVLCNHERRQNDRFLKLAECRICAVAGDARGATALAGPLPLHHASAWPEYHLHRLAGEALARAGRIEEALERLEAARRNVAPEADTFLKLVLLTAGAREALLRLERDRKGWEEPARQFADVYECYKPGQIRWPAARGGRTRWADRLRRALESIPY